MVILYVSFVGFVKDFVIINVLLGWCLVFIVVLCVG